MRSKKIKAKSISNIIKALIVMFIFFEYHYQSILNKAPLSSDDCQGLLFIAISGFLILLPVDGSIFIKNFFAYKKDLVDENKK